MNCQAIDIKAYSFGEGPAADRRATELHLNSCDHCRTELAQLQLVHAALGGLREEEPPRRIAFVSDKVFEPTWWQRFWASGPQVGFAASGMLAGAILIHGFSHPLTATTASATPAPVIAQVDEQDQQKRIDAAVAKAVARIEEREQTKVTQLLAATEKKYELERQALALAWDDNKLLRLQNDRMRIQTAGLVKD